MENQANSAKILSMGVIEKINRATRGAPFLFPFLPLCWKQFHTPVRHGLVNSMNLQYLRNFYFITKFGNFTKAAEAVHRTQSTLSSQIKNLEEELGCPLFERNGRQNVILTPAGEVLLEFAKSIIRQYDDLEMRMGELQSSTSEETGRLRIGAAPSVVDSLLPFHISRFQNEYPGIKIQLFSRSPADIFEQVREGFLDIGISLDSAIPKNFEAHEWLPLRLTLMLPYGHPLIGVATPTIHDILKYPLIMPTNSRFLTRLLYDQQVMDMGIEPNIVLESDYNVTHAKYVHAGFGISFMNLPDDTIAKFKKTICCINLDSLAPPLFLKFFHRKSTKLNRIKNFIQFMKEHRDDCKDE